MLDATLNSLIRRSATNNKEELHSGGTAVRCRALTCLGVATTVVDANWNVAVVLLSRYRYDAKYIRGKLLCLTRDAAGRLEDRLVFHVSSLCLRLDRCRTYAPTGFQRVGIS